MKLELVGRRFVTFFMVLDMFLDRVSSHQVIPLFPLLEFN